jgi:hypothetical protein
VGIEVPTNNSGDLWVGLNVKYVFQELSIVHVMVDVDGVEGTQPKVNVKCYDVMAQSQV